jgi:catechol 2,3-dioxygenase-like lactoylglutathione lyase family enzyme
MKVTQLNHVALHVADLDRSCQFYESVLGLARMERPAFRFPGAWYRIGADQELHLIARAPEVATVPRERHWALMVDDIAGFARHLHQAAITFSGPKPRPDGAQQIFLNDPDGHVIELCTPPADT